MLRPLSHDNFQVGNPLAEIDSRVVELLITPFARVERQLEELSVRISQTVSSILRHLQTNLKVQLPGPFGSPSGLNNISLACESLRPMHM